MVEEKVIINRQLPYWARPLRFIYSFVSRVFVPKEGLKCIKRGPLKYLVWLGEDVGRRLYLQHSYEKDETALFKKIIRPGDICIDVGGNIGYYSLNFAMNCGPTGHVYVFEPILKNVLVIKLAAILNELENIEVFDSVVSDVSGPVVLNIPENDSSYAYMSKDIKKENVGGINKSTTLDAFVKEKSIAAVSVLKVDVEGGELLVLKGAESLLSNIDTRPRVVMLELIDEFLARFDSSIDNVIDFMKKYDYKPYYPVSGGEVLAFEPKDKNRVFNVFFICD